MSGEIEAAGAAITASLAAKVIDGKDPAHAAHGQGACANCGAEINGRFCANCGQPAHIHRSLLHMIEELLHGLFHFDARAWRMAPLILFRPGTLTRSYVRGKRASYISPLAMYLLAIFAMFFVFSMVADDKPNVMSPEARTQAANKVIAAETASLARNHAQLRRLQDVAAKAKPEDKAEADANVREAEKDLAQTQKEFEKARDALAKAAAPHPAAPADGDKSVTVAPNGDVTSTSTFEPRDGETVYDAIRREANSGQLNVNTGWRFLDRKLDEKARNPELFVYQLQRTISEFSFLLVPISLPFMWLLFAWKRGLTLFDHAVFVLYSLSFVSILTIVAFVLMRIPGAGGWVWTAVVLALPVHNFFHLKGAYALGWFSATWRTAALLFISLFCLSVFLVAIVVLGLVE